MKILIVSKKEDSNPFVKTLSEGLLSLNIDVVCSVAEFWSTESKFDIIHFMWPEAIFNWKNSISSSQVEKFRNRLLYYKGCGCKIIITIHNLKPHLIKDNNVLMLFDIIYGECDAFIHLGCYSKQLLEAKYPLAGHYIIPHHIYDSVYDFSIAKSDARRLLNISNEQDVILAFGQFRSDDERKLVFVIKSKLGSQLQLLVPGFYRDKILTRRIWRIPKILYKTLYYKFNRIKFSKKYVDVKDTSLLFSAADIVFIQRKQILNSGNLPMGFAAGKVVVGPQVGNVGEILKSTGNPTFNPDNEQSVVEAVKKGLALVKQGLGERNKNFALSQWSTHKVSLLLIDKYNLVLKHNKKYE